MITYDVCENCGRRRPQGLENEQDDGTCLCGKERWVEKTVEESEKIREKFYKQNYKQNND